MSKSHRVQALLSDEQFQLLETLSQKEGKTISSLIRHAVDVAYVAEVERQKRTTAYQRLISRQLPVSDWDEMKGEITRGALGSQTDLH